MSPHQFWTTDLQTFLCDEEATLRFIFFSKEASLILTCFLSRVQGTLAPSRAPQHPVLMNRTKKSHRNALGRLNAGRAIPEITCIQHAFLPLVSGGRNAGNGCRWWMKPP